MDSPKISANMNIGTNAGIGRWVQADQAVPQPHWKTATTTP